MVWCAFDFLGLGALETEWLCEHQPIDLMRVCSFIHKSPMIEKHGACGTEMANIKGQ